MLSINIQFLCIHGSESAGSTNQGLCNSVVYNWKKNPCIIRSLHFTQFKPMLFKGQLYFFIKKLVTALGFAIYIFTANLS